MTTDASASQAGSGATVNVVAREFALTLDRTQVEGGPITFAFRNEGRLPHDFAIQGKGVDEKTALIERGATASLRVTLSPGAYTYLCTAPGHEHLDMRGTFEVISVI